MCCPCPDFIRNLWPSPQQTVELQELESSQNQINTPTITSPTSSNSYTRQQEISTLTSNDGAFVSTIKDWMSVTHKLKIFSIPTQEALLTSYASEDYPNNSDCHLKNWFPQKQNEFVDNLLEKKIPLKKRPLHQLFDLLKKYQENICCHPQIKYPALFRGLSYQKTYTHSNEIEFELEIHSKSRIFIIFQIPENEEQISNSVTKTIQVFSLFDSTKRT